MNIKKIITLGFILILSFPMLYLPLSANAQGLSVPSDNMPYTYEEWRIYILELNRMTLEDLDSLEPQSIYYLNSQARIYAGWSNGTYTYEESLRLFKELHSTPIISTPTFIRHDDGKFKARTNIWVIPLAMEHCFRVYQYLDYKTGTIDEDAGDLFHDLDDEKGKYPGPWPGYLIGHNYPYVTLPFISDLDPYEGFLGSDYVKTTHHGQQISPVDWYTFELDNTFDGKVYSTPRTVYFIIQMLWRFDILTPFTANYQCYFYWETKVYEVTINDDDTTGPILPVECIFGSIDPIHPPSFIYDSDDSFEVDVLGYDLESGLGNRITFDGQEVDDGEYLDDVLIELGGLFGENLYADWYRYTITNDFDYTPGYKTVNLKVWNNDNDGWAGDPDSTTEQVSFWVIDDDSTPPVIDPEYTGDGTDGNAGKLIINASDASGLSVDPSGEYDVPNSLGTHPFSFVATDNDTDRTGDSLTTTLDYPITIIDDDIYEPYIENLMVVDDPPWLNISFTAKDDLHGDDEGLSNVSVYVDGNLKYTGSTLSYETAFDLSFPNDWIWVPGSHEIQIYLIDADNDRSSDSLPNTITTEFMVTLDEMYQYVMWLCEEINNYIYDKGIVALRGVVTQKLVKIQALLWEAYQLIQDGYLHTGLVRQKMAEIKLEIAETKTELMISKQSMSLEHFDHLQECIRDVRNRIVELMGLGIGEFSHDISLVEIDVYNLRDFVEDNINATDSENLVNSITLTAEKLENAIFDISLDKSTEGSLTSAQNALGNVLTEVFALARKGKITEEMKTTLWVEILLIQERIESLKQQI